MNALCKLATRLVMLASFLLPLGLQAQVRVDLSLSKREYVAHEPVEATVTLTNRAGVDLFIHGEGVGRQTMSWLDFSITNSRGTTLTPMTQVNFKSVRVPAGQSISQTIRINAVYSMADLGNYSCTAVVRLPNQGGVFKSNRTSFNVTKGTPVYRQRIGNPASRNVREITLSLFNDSQRTSLYVHIVDVRSGRTLQAIKLGEALAFEKPTATMDGQNILHVLYLQSPGVFAEARVSPDGAFLGTKYFTRGQAGKPSLQTFANGEVVVASAVPYNPEAEKQQQAQIRRLSERPALTYR